MVALIHVFHILDFMRPRRHLKASADRIDVSRSAGPAVRFLKTGSCSRPSQDRDWPFAADVVNRANSRLFCRGLHEWYFGSHAIPARQCAFPLLSGPGGIWLMWRFIPIVCPKGFGFGDC